MMGNQNLKEIPEDGEDKENITVIIEKEKNSKLSDHAEGTFIIPNTSNCVKIADLIFSIVQSPISLFLGGQDYTHNYTPLNMLNSLMEDGCLYLTYSEKLKFSEECFILDDYVKPNEVKFHGPPKIKIRPSLDGQGQKVKIIAWDECNVRQLALIVERILKVKNVVLYYNEKILSREKLIGNLVKYRQIDGIIHLEYKIC
jgi:hypothetical protein